MKALGLRREFSDGTPLEDTADDRGQPLPSNGERASLASSYDAGDAPRCPHEDGRSLDVETISAGRVARSHGTTPSVSGSARGCRKRPIPTVSTILVTHPLADECADRNADDETDDSGYTSPCEEYVWRRGGAD